MSWRMEMFPLDTTMKPYKIGAIAETMLCDVALDIV